MSAIEQAIKEAVEKGEYFPNLKPKKWRVTGYSLQYEMETGRWPFKWKRWQHIMRTECIFLDPFFWQALGKAQGWKRLAWRENWVKLIYHLAEKKDAESFFDQL